LRAITPVVQRIAQVVPRVRLLINHRLYLFGKGGALFRRQRSNFRAQVGQGSVNPVYAALCRCW
jgi:hypothetical protein